VQVHAQIRSAANSFGLNIRKETKMALTSLFTETPIEAALWSFSVSLQEKLAESIFNTPFFKGAVALYMGFVIAKGLARMGFGRSEGVWLSVASKTLCCLLGLSFLGSMSAGSFRPESESGQPWANKSAVQNSGKFTSLQSNAHGLKFYRIAAEGMNSLAAAVSKAVANVFGDSGYARSPRLLLQTLHEAARHTIDDPEILSTIDSLFESCAKAGTASSQVAYVSLSSQFDLGKENCASLHSKLKSQLDYWAMTRLSSPGSYLMKFAEVARNNPVTRAIGLDDSEALRNKVIASAVSDYLQSRTGLSDNNVSQAALLENPSDSSILGTSSWVNLSRKLSLGGFLNSLVRPLTGTDYEAADSRNDMAALYTRVNVFLPALRGFAKGILALMFLVAAARMAFGSTSLMVSWLWCLLLVTAYEPLSTFLYQATITLTQAPETVEAMSALKRDPLVIVGAQVIDSYASKIQATYFVLQLGLCAICATGGLAVFRYQRALGGALASSIVMKGLNVARTVSTINAGGAGGAVRATGGSASARSGGGAPVI
jgi:hypothetical protein